MATHLSRLALAVGLLVAVGCNSAARVHVNYRQIANFSEYRLSPDASSSYSAGVGNIYVMYKITQINNMGSEAVAFTFDVNNVSTVTDQVMNDTVLNSPILLAAQNLTTVNVPAGQVVNVNRCIIKVASLGNLPALSQIDVNYAGTTQQPVTMNNVAPSDPVAGVINALPNPLQSLCSSN